MTAQSYKPHSITGHHALAWWLCAATLVTFAAGCSKPEDKPEEIVPETATCERDAIKSEADAVALVAGEAQEGFVCPVEDVDWFAYEVPASHSVIKVNLKMGAPLSPVEPNYSIWSAKDGAKDVLVAQPQTSRVGAAFSESHCVPSGGVLVKVHDLGDDTQDVRYKYTLDISSREDIDKQEPNEDFMQATALNPGQEVTAAISCQNDQDWYKISLPQNSLLKLKLTSGIAGYEPAIRIFDAEQNQLIEEINKSGSVMPTEIDRFEVLNGAGDYYITVSDDDDEQANPDAPYTLIVEYITDQDNNEPNNNPATATAITNTPVDCTGGLQEITFQGTVGAESDQDWFSLPLGPGCQGRILDASVELEGGGLSTADAWEFQNDFQISLSMIRSHTESSCTRDAECNALQLPCDNDLACAGYFETCLPDGLCAGASSCLPGGTCAANQVIRSYECNPRLAQCQPGGQAPPAMRAEISAPLFDGEVVYLKVNDFQSDKEASDRVYTLRVRVRVDSDTEEPSNLFLNELPKDSLSGSPHRDFARDIAVHDCTTGDCCDNSTWIDGSLAYENDLDWFRYPHPCPGEDCTMRMKYEVDGGPVDFVVNLYRGDSSLWFTAFDNDEQENQSPKQGSMGGMTAADRCFYAYQGHQASNNNAYYYYVVVRDLLELYEDPNVSQRIPIPGSRDWSGSQRYRICVEKIANLCSEPPCQLYDDGCGQPQ